MRGWGDGETFYYKEFGGNDITAFSQKGRGIGLACVASLTLNTSLHFLKAKQRSFAVRAKKCAHRTLYNKNFIKKVSSYYE
jgi:hypothetical protein